tara:strand:- start:4878 stop:5951 length:1074 start_codon:yes stop_codon:yes gene_type:complete
MTLANSFSASKQPGSLSHQNTPINVRCSHARTLGSPNMSLYNELHRPQFHFSARENWINDPNGLVYRDGVWHLFFQHNPEATVWGNMTWGHAVSDDLMHWRQLEHALYPDEHGTMFSGSAVVDHENTAGFGDGALLVFYTAAGDFVEPKRPHTQCLAYSVDNGERWTKYAGNPVVQSFEAGNRDPKVVWHPGTRQWIMALYLADDRYCLLNSTDARAWTRFQDLRLEGEWHLWILTTGHPGNLDASTIRRIAPGLCGIAVTALLADQGFGFRNELSAIKAADQVDAPGTPEYPTLGSGFIPQRDQQMSIPVELSLAGSGNEVTLVRWPALATRSPWYAGRSENWMPCVTEPSALNGR